MGNHRQPSPLRSLTPGLLALAIIVTGAAAASPAAAAQKHFKPVAKVGRTLVFEPRGVSPNMIRRARVSARTEKRSVRRPVAASRVRRALERRTRVRIRFRHEPRKGRLKVKIRPAAGSSDPGTGPCTIGLFSAQTPPGACWRPYGAASPFNTPVGANPRLAPNSSQIVERLTSFGPGPGNVEGGNADTAMDWSHPIYYSQPTDPVYRVSIDAHRWSGEIHGMQIPIPAEALPAGGSDHHLTVIDQASGWEYDFWGVDKKADGEIHAITGGRTRIDGDGLGSDATAAQFGLAAGMIRPAELAAGKIDHALFIDVKCTNGTEVYPADPNMGAGRRCSAIGLPEVNAPALGQHFFLDMRTAEIDALPVASWQRTILHAMAEYGMYVGDTGGSPWSLKFESGSSFTSFGLPDPWVKLGGKLGVPAWNDPSTGRTIRVFELGGLVDWGRELAVVAP